MSERYSYYATETDLVRAIRDLLTLRCALSIRVNAGVQVIEDENGKRRIFRGAEKGTSDIIACVRGVFIAIEAKMPGNKPTQAQLDFLERVRQAGGVGIVAYDVETVNNLVDEIERRK